MTLAAVTLADLSECGALGVRQARLTLELRAENSVLRDEVFALEEQALVD
jgi:hypothetical protein